jgi:hypothetical protein
VAVVTVHGALERADGRPDSGTVSWSIPTPLRDHTGNAVIGPDTISAELAPDGSFSVTVPAVDAPTLTPSGWAYTVTVNTAGWSTTFQAQVFAATPSVAFADVVPVALVGTYGTAIQSLTAADSSIVVGGNASAVTLRVGTVSQAAVTGLAAALAALVPTATVTAAGDLLAALGSGTVTRLGVGTTGQVLTVDPGQPTGLRWTTPVAGGSAAPLVVRQQRVLTGDTTLPNTGGAWVPLSGFELDIPAVAGDWVEIGLHGMHSTTATAFLDTAILVGSSIVRYLSTGTINPTAEGDPAWYISTGFTSQSGPLGLSVTSGDLDGGVLRVAIVVRAQGSGVLYSSASYPFSWWAKNTGPHQ